MGKVISWSGSEHVEQVALFEWAAIHTVLYPELALLFAIPNGGHRHISVAARMKREGQKPGVPDICLPVPSKGWHGLFIELKYGRNKPSEAQDWWLAQLTEQDYLAVVCYGWQDAVDTIRDYLGIDEA